MRGSSDVGKLSFQECRVAQDRCVRWICARNRQHSHSVTANYPGAKETTSELRKGRLRFNDFGGTIGWAYSSNAS